MIGTKLGKYEVVAKVGRGGTGAVYRAIEHPGERVVALKVLAETLSFDGRSLKRFMQEQQVLKRIDHPNIVRSLSPIVKEGETHFFAMEYVAGKDLAKIVKTFGKLGVADALRIAATILAALECAHEQGIIHRDIKPGNILMDRDGKVLLTDFGLAKCTDLTRLTITGEVMGTPEFMSPEQAEGHAVDHRTDLYSLGVVVFLMLTGRLPFVADSPLAVLRKHREEMPPPLCKLEPSLPPDLERIVGRALEKDPAKRFASAREMREAIESVGFSPGEQQDSPLRIQIGKMVNEDTLVLPAGPKKRRWKAVVAGGVAVVVVLAAVGAGLAYRNGWFEKEKPTSPVPGPVTPAVSLPRIVLTDGQAISGRPLHMSEDKTLLYYEDENRQTKTVELARIKRIEYGER